MSGVGPKVALAIVSGSPVAELRRAIVREDSARFQAIPGIGKKTAERIVLELKEKLGDPDSSPVPDGSGDDHVVARDALVELGWSLLDAERALAEVDPELPPEERVRLALKTGCMNATTQFLTPALRDDEEEVERSLRPRRLDEFVGQARVKEQLAIALEAAKGRGEALDHVLLVGPPGLGKTSLAHIIREELGVGIRSVAGPALERKDVAAILTAVEARDVVFVDEIHRLSRAAEEILYPALEDFRLDIVMGQGTAARTLTLDLPPFTLVGATTRTGPAHLAAARPLRDDVPARLLRGRRARRRSSAARPRILGVEIADDAADEIAGRARGTPRVGNRILRRVRDVAEVRHEGAITTAIAREALELLEVDEAGLERLDRELLRSIAEKYDGGPVGLNTLAAALGEEPDTIEYVYEPYLLQLGFLAADAARPHDHRARPRASRRGAAAEPDARLF